MQVNLQNQSVEPIKSIISFDNSEVATIDKNKNENTNATVKKEIKLNPRVDEILKDKRRDVPDSTSYMDDPAMQMFIIKLQARDLEVRAHESAHMSAGAGTGGASFTYQVGPNGKLYAIGGEVPIDLGGGNTPEETISKMQSVKAAALAPSSPSPQDLKVAASAGMIESKARSELSLKDKEDEAVEGEKNIKNKNNENEVNEIVNIIS